MPKVIREVTSTEIRTSSLSPPVPAPDLGKRRGARVLVVVVGLAAFAALVALLYTASVHNVTGDSDGATAVLEGQSMAGGNVMLHGWALSLDSFWTVDAPFYMVIEFVTGVRGVLLQLVPAVVGASVIFMGAWLARDGRRGMAGFAAAATVLVLLGLPSHVLSLFLLRGPLHVGTALWCLVAFAGLRSGRVGRGWVVAVCFFAAGALGDFLMIALGIVPACAAGVVAMLRARSWRSGVPALSAAGAGLIVTWVVRAIATAVGTFSVATSHPKASASEMLGNLGRVATWGADMLGVGNAGFTSGGVPAPLQAVHVLGLLVVVAGVIGALRSLVLGLMRGSSPSEGCARAWRLDDLLVMALVADIVVFVVLTSSTDQQFMRYLTAAVIFGSVLAGRMMGRLAAAASARRRRAGSPVLVAAVAALVAALCFNVTAAPPARPYAQLGQFLEAHHLDQGIGDYWSASVTTVGTANSVKVRPVITTPQGRVVRYGRQSTSSWYTNQSFQFLVFDSGRPWGGVDAATAAATFGPVTRTYVVGTYRVLVWSHPVRVSSIGFSPIPR